MTMSLLFAVPLLVVDVDPALRDGVRPRVAAYLEAGGASGDTTPSSEESVSTSYCKARAPIPVDAALDELGQVVIGAGRRFLEKGLGLPPRGLDVERAGSK